MRVRTQSGIQVRRNGSSGHGPEINNNNSTNKRVKQSINISYNTQLQYITAFIPGAPEGLVFPVPLKNIRVIGI